MITCQHAKHLFDQYLDGELSPSLQTELHAHQLQCSDCQGELALLESCGDVIAYDRCEPVLSDSFTDRVLFAQRATIKPVIGSSNKLQRRWVRHVLMVASPVAAAACVVLAVLLAGPTGQTGQPSHQTWVAGITNTVSGPSRELLNLTGKHGQGTADELAASNGFVDAMLGRCIEQVKTTANGTQRSVEQLSSFVRQGVADTRSALASGSRSAVRDVQATDSAGSAINGPEMMVPVSPSSPSMRSKTIDTANSSDGELL